MYEHQKTLTKIERLVDALPYQSVRIEIEMKNQTYTLQKEKPRECGFINQWRGDK